MAFGKNVFLRASVSYDLESPENPSLHSQSGEEVDVVTIFWACVGIKGTRLTSEFSHHDAAADAEAAKPRVLSLADRFGLSDLSEIQVAAERPIQPKDVSLRRASNIG